jgi:hypothetical protein
MINSTVISAVVGFFDSRTLYAGIAIAFVFIAAFFLSRYIWARLKKHSLDLITPIVRESQSDHREFSERIERTEKALVSFADAMQEYAKHMASHTSAIQGLSEASQSLKNSAMEQNLILDRLSHTLEEEKHVREVARVEKTVIELEKRTALIQQVKDELEHKTPRPDVNLSQESLVITVIKPPPGCIVKSSAYHRRNTYAR